MSASFTVSPIVGGGVLVEGVDAAGREGTAILRSEAWNFVVEYKAKVEAEAAFDGEVEEFFAPLLEAAEKFQAATESAADQVTVVLAPGTEHVAEVPPVEVVLDAAGVVLQALDAGQFDSLRWVAGDLVVVA